MYGAEMSWAEWPEWCKALWLSLGPVMIGLAWWLSGLDTTEGEQKR